MTHAEIMEKLQPVFRDIVDDDEITITDYIAADYLRGVEKEGVKVINHWSKI